MCGQGQRLSCSLEYGLMCNVSMCHKNDLTLKYMYLRHLWSFTVVDWCHPLPDEALKLFAHCEFLTRYCT